MTPSQTPAPSHRAVKAPRRSQGRGSFASLTAMLLALGVALAALVGVQAPASAMTTTQLQSNLAGLDYHDFDQVDGSFGPKTKSAVRSFQIDRNLSVDADPGPKTEAALTDLVKKIQTKVGVTADGSFGPGTKAAVKKWQSANGLGADGIAGPNTMAKMGIQRVIRPAATGTKAERIIKTAQLEVGISESPAATKRYVNWYSQWVANGWTSENVEWCAIFVSTMTNHRTNATSLVSAWVPDWDRAAKNRTNGLSLTTSPAAGDIVTFDWDRDGKSDHIGLVEKTDSKYIYTVEGNSSAQVKRNARPRTLSMKFLRVS